MTRSIALAAFICLAATAQADTIVVQAGGGTFSPANLVIQVGDTVRWEHSLGIHTVSEGTDGVVNGNEAFHSPLTTFVPVFEHTFDAAFLAAHPRPGDRYDYFCDVHWLFGMIGTVTVTSPPGTAFCDCPAISAPCSNPGGAGEGCANSTGAGGKLRGSGSASAVADDLTFVATMLLPGQPALLFSADNAVNGGNGVTFGDGLRCAGGQLKRLGVAVPGSTGQASWGPGLGVAGGWSAGSTRRFQAWYRNPVGGPCGNGFNLSNGYEVSFH
ncbi:MAG: plastocyanin/azurin family copper-binding protein [bacterium]|jgi:plastocyanin